MAKIKGSCEKFVESLNDDERRKFDAEYTQLLISEMLIAAMEKDNISVRELAKAAGVSPTTIQGIRSGINNPTIENFLRIFKALGYSIVAEKDEERFPIEIPHV